VSGLHRVVTHSHLDQESNSQPLESETDAKSVASPCHNVTLVVHIGCVLVAAVEKAIQALNNRYFAGRRVHAHVYDQTLFDRGDLSG